MNGHRKERVAHVRCESQWAIVSTRRRVVDAASMPRTCHKRRALLLLRMIVDDAQPRVKVRYDAFVCSAVLPVAA